MTVRQDEIAAAFGLIVCVMISGDQCQSDPIVAGYQMALNQFANFAWQTGEKIRIRRLAGAHERR